MFLFVYFCGFVLLLTDLCIGSVCLPELKTAPSSLSDFFLVLTDVNFLEHNLVHWAASCV